MGPTIINRWCARSHCHHRQARLSDANTADYVGSSQSISSVSPSLYVKDTLNLLIQLSIHETATDYIMYNGSNTTTNERTIDDICDKLVRADRHRALVGG